MWDHPPLAEFAYNNSNQKSFCMALFEALYYWPCCSLIFWGEVGDTTFLGSAMICDIYAHISLNHKKMKTTHSRQASYEDEKN